MSRVIAVVLALALSCAAVLLSLVADSRVWLHSSGELHVWYHFGMFAVLALLSVCISKRTSTRLVWLFAFLLLGPSMEYGEALRFHGYVEWNDVATDALGVALGGLAGWLLWKRPRGPGRTP
jgi:hypothetical protein